MATTADKRILISDIPLAWVYILASGSPGTVTSLYKFDNLQSGTIKLPNSAADAATGEKIEIKRGDGVTWQAAKEVKVLSIADETEVSTGSSSDATGEGEITIVTNEAPLPTSINSMTLFIDDIQSKKANLFLIIVPTGFTYEGKNNSKVADGYAYMLGKLTSDIEIVKGETPTSLTFTFSSNKCTLTGVDTALLEAIDFSANGIVHKGFGDSYLPDDITTGMATKLIAGKVAFASSPAYSYS